MFPYSDVRLCLSNEMRVLDLTMALNEYEALMPYIRDQLGFDAEMMVRVYDELVRRAVEVVVQSTLLSDTCDHVRMQTSVLIQAFPQLYNVTVHTVAGNLTQETVSPSIKFKCLVSARTAILVKEHYR